ncbi:MAG: ABC transporter substrate-binding protein [Oligoflexia bacterium]|nr:ABC transporter substrate-binding protein [Oligoflexia bacterium]
MMRLFVFLSVAFAVVLTGCTKKKEQNLNVLQLATSAKIKGLDPAGAQDLYSSSEIMRVYEGLLQYHPLKRPYELEPLLAAEMPKISKDSLTYTFKIRKGVKFHDDAAFPEGKGREVTAKDFEYSFKRLADPRVQSTGWWLFEGRLKGLDDWRKKYTNTKDTPTNYDDEVEGLKALDDETLQLKLTQPYPQLLYALAMPYGAVVAKEAVDKYGKEFINHAVGTGPFILESFNPSDAIAYKKNPNYWEATYPTEGESSDKENGLLEDAGKKIPFVDGINVRVIVEEQPRWLHFLKGELDTSGIPKDSFNDAVKPADPAKPLTYDNLALSDDLKSKNIQMTIAIAMDFTYTAFNTDSKDIPQLKDKKVRQAISLALDDKESIQLFYNGMATSSQTPIPPGINGYDPDFVNPYRTGDVEKARKLLAEAGYPGGKGFPELPYDTVASATNRQMADYASKQLDKIGIKLKVISSTWPQMLERIQNRQAQMWGIAWAADYPDAENFLQLFYGPNAQPGGMNGSYYRNKDFDRLFEKARVLADTPARTAMYKQLSKMVAEDAPVVFGLHRIGVGLRQSWIKNFKYDEFAFNRSKYLRIDTEEKKKHLQ